jgi:hypothetical protein
MKKLVKITQSQTIDIDVKLIRQLTAFILRDCWQGV